jgi:hypothetical protein
MKNSLLLATLGTLLLLSAPGASAQSAEDFAAPPLASLTAAKTIFIHNDGAGSIVYDAFCDAIRDWGKYTIVSSPGDADLTVELSYSAPDKADQGAPSWGGNSFVAAQPKREKTGAEITLTLYDSRTSQALWSASDPQKHALREKNRDREAIQSVQHLVSDLELRAGASQ